MGMMIKYLLSVFSVIINRQCEPHTFHVNHEMKHGKKFFFALFFMLLRKTALASKDSSVLNVPFVFPTFVKFP